MGRYYDSWITMSDRILSDYGSLSYKPHYPNWARRALGAMRTINSVLKHKDTKFILFDTEQANILLNAGEPPEPKGLPFPQFALEFTESFMVTEESLLSEDGSYIGASFIMGAMFKDGVEHELIIDNDPGDVIGVMLMLSDRPNVASLDSWVSFGLSLSTGDIYYTAYFLRTQTKQIVPESIPDNKFVKLDLEQNDSGAYTQFALLIRWLLGYMTGSVRGINLAPIQVSRAERRRAQKDNRTPPEWYTMKVGGKYARDPEDVVLTRKSGRHSYKYDVRGHIRRGRYRLGDGSYREVLQFIPAHQRGLRHTLYIPRVTDFQATDKIETQE